jgi:hypothetical protein
VSYRLDGNVAVIEIDNPPVNDTGVCVPEGLAEALRAAAADPKVAALVLAGLSNKFPTLPGLEAQIRSSVKPIVAAIEGVVPGGGFELALACHWRVASKSAKVGSPGLVDALADDALAVAIEFARRAARERAPLRLAGDLNSPQRKAGVHVFLAEQEARNIPDVPADVQPLPIHGAAIIGAGTITARRKRSPPRCLWADF